MRYFAVLVALLLFASPSLAQDLTVTISAPKLQVMEAGYQATRTRWYLVAVDVPNGSLWLALSGSSRSRAYDCNVHIIEAQDGSTVAIRLFDREERVKEKQRAKLAQEVLAGIRAHLGDRTAELRPDSVIDHSDPYRKILRGYSADAVYREIARPDAHFWTIMREDSAAHAVTFMAARAHSAADVMVVSVTDVGYSEVRLDFTFRSAAGSQVNIGYEGQATASRLFTESVLNALKERAASR